MPQPLMPNKLKLNGSVKTYSSDHLELTPKKDVLFIIEDWKAKVGSQEIPGYQVKRYQANLALEYKMKQGKG